MATVKLHPALDTITGKSGGLVFRRLRGKTVLAQRPSPRKARATPAQLAQRRRFKEAGDYARAVLADPWQRRAYEVLARAQNRRVDKLVESDFLTPPVVEEIDGSTYQRRRGGVIRVLASDDVEVVAVRVAIATAAGAAVEDGAAAKVHGVWVYTATAAAPAGELTITATAWDRPGHTASRSLASR